MSDCDPMDCSLAGTSVCGILQAKIVEWVSIPFFRELFWPRDRTWVSCIAGGVFNIWTTREALSIRDWVPSDHVSFSQRQSPLTPPSSFLLTFVCCIQNHRKGAHGCQHWWRPLWGHRYLFQRRPSHSLLNSLISEVKALLILYRSRKNILWGFFAVHPAYFWVPSSSLVLMLALPLKFSENFYSSF